jgi:hypothetical protein
MPGGASGFGPRGRGNKFGAVRTRVDGRTFASKAEAGRYGELQLLAKAGLIADLECQPAWTFEINGRLLKIGARAVRYTADFAFTDRATGERVVEDVKGRITNDAQLRIALMEAIHGITVRLVGKTNTRRKTWTKPPGAQ